MSPNEFHGDQQRKHTDTCLPSTPLQQFSVRRRLGPTRQVLHIDRRRDSCYKQVTDCVHVSGRYLLTLPLTAKWA